MRRSAGPGVDAVDGALRGVEPRRRAARSGRAAKPFVDDGNSFWSLAGVPAITHGPRAGGQHTLEEWVSVDDLERVALLYAATAASYGSQGL